MMLLNRNRSFVKAAFMRAISQSSRTTSTGQVKATSIEQKSDKPARDPNVVSLDDVNLVTRNYEKLPARDPLVKRFFICVVDREMLGYPEVLEKDELDKIVYTLRPISKHFAQKGPSSGVDGLLSDSKALKLFAGNVPETHGGLSHFSTETLLSMEAESVNASDALILNTHRLFTQTIKEHGSEEQHTRFLRKLGKGEWIGTMTLLEEGNNANNLSTKAESDGNDWIMNGYKEYVINAANADYLLVAAQTNTRDYLGDNTDTVTLFIVDRRLPGVTVHEPNVTIGCNGMNQSRVSFKNVRVAGSNLLSEPGKGQEILSKLTLTSRVQAAVLNVTQMKKIVNFLIQQCINTDISKVKLSDLAAIKDSLGHAACAVYATESMIYMTSSLPDIYDKPDIDLETAIVKVYSQKKLLEIATMALDFLGGDLVSKGNVIEQAIRDAVQLHVTGEPNELLKLFIGSTGLQYRGSFVYKDIKKDRNPLFHPQYIYNKILKYQSIEHAEPKLDLLEHLHPSFDVATDHLERSIGRLCKGTDIMLANYGKDVMKQHVEILRLGESAIEIYALFCSVARASRSYCIGLRHADHERLIATCLAHTASEKVLQLMTEIEKGSIWAYDTHFDKLAEHLFYCKEYFPEHPLTRNF